MVSPMFFSDSSDPTRRVPHLPQKQWWLVFYFCGAVVVQCPLPPHADVLTSSRIGNYISASFALLRHLSVRQMRISWTAVRRQWTSYLQKSTPVYSYYVCGYVSKKSGQASNRACSSTSEFTDLVSRGLLNHPPKWLLIFGQFCHANFQSSDICCVNHLMAAFHLIFDTFDISIDHRALQSITRRFSNCMIRGLVRRDTETATISSSCASKWVIKKLNSWVELHDMFTSIVRSLLAYQCLFYLRAPL